VPRWVAFAALTLAVLAVLLIATRTSTRVVDELAGQQHRARLPDGADHLEGIDAQTVSQRRISTETLLANVAVSQGLFAAVLLVGIALTDIPVATLGVGSGSLAGGETVVAGIGIGLSIAVANTLAGGVADSFDVDPSETLRELLTPESRRGWALLLLVTLPIIAGFEELLFRGILIGAFSAGFDISPWLLVAGSSVAFATGHGAQGTLGIVVTGLLGFVLAVVFVVTGSLFVVVIAHYLVNAVEFLIEGLGYEPFEE
jgi:membrane protease YdiL (CAAX protease family)